MVISDLKICSLNCRGLGNFKKRRDVFNKLRREGYNIILLQDIHCKVGKENSFRNSWGKDILVAPYTHNARGVAVLTHGVDAEFSDVIIDKEGNFIIAKVVVNKMHQFILVNIYAPNEDDPAFFSNLDSLLGEQNDLPIIIAGDWNLVINQEEDTQGYRRSNHPRARSRVLEILHQRNLVDIYRVRHSGERRYTWRVMNPEPKQARLDFFLISEELCAITADADISPGYRTDHSLVYLALNFVGQPKGRGLFRFNCSLLTDKEYSSIVRRTIKNTVMDYALPVYTYDFVNSALGNERFSDLQFSISDSLLFEVLILNIRTETITYGIRKAKRYKRDENALNDTISRLEKQMSSNPNVETADALAEQQRKLEEHREHLMRGNITRSRVKWYEEAERSTKYFLNLEKRNYVSKLIPCLLSDNGEVIQNQTEILSALQRHFSEVFRLHDNEDDHIDFLNAIELKKLSSVDFGEMKKPLTLDEVGRALYAMKNNKSPGSDGFPAEFYKYFWADLKYIVMRMLTSCYETRVMPPSLQEGIIILIPKSGKPRNQINSYRPITLLNTSYKILSASIANRYRRVISKLVDPAQSAYIKGRFIGDNTRLMSDIIAYLKDERKSGIFLSLDIEGAFNSVSWKFIDSALAKYNIPSEIIRWFNIMNEGAHARVLYNGHLSEKINLFRACRQGDPVSPYIFLLAIECLATIVRQNNNIKGIIINGVENKVSCYADDTLFFLDGSINSCRCLFHDLGIFAKYSGLRPNIAKTQAMWVGYDIESRVKICDDLPIHWTKKMKVLGIIFENHLMNMSKNNLDGKLDEVKAAIKSWQRRHLTFYGKICVIKSLLVPKLTHLFSTLPNPPPEFMQALNTILFKFVWNGGRDKISRRSVVQQVQSGGAGMMDIHLYLKALKVSWVRRQLQSDSPWAKLFEGKIGLGNCIWDRNARSLRNFSRSIHATYRFWSEVVEAVADFKAAYGDYNPDDMASCSLWFSDYSKFHTNCIRSWYCKGMHFLNDLLNSDGTIMTFEQAQLQYEIVGTQFDYDSLVASLPGSWKRTNKIKLTGPLIDPALSYILSHSHGVKHIYNKLIEKNMREFTHKWECKWNEVFSDVAWKDVYLNNILTTNSMRYRSIQYKIITRTHVTQRLLYRMGASESSHCVRCHEIEDNIEHKFWQCSFVQTFWKSIKDWLISNRILEAGSEFNSKTVLLGLGASTLINHVSIVAKMIIAKREHLSLNEVIAWLRNDRDLESMVARYKRDSCDFEKKWNGVTEAMLTI